MPCLPELDLKVGSEVTRLRRKQVEHLSYVATVRPALEGGNPAVIVRFRSNASGSGSRSQNVGLVASERQPSMPAKALDWPKISAAFRLHKALQLAALKAGRASNLAKLLLRCS